MNVAVVIATCGGDHWRNLAADRAYPSAFREATAGPGRVGHMAHYPDLTVSEARNRAAAEVPGGFDWLCFLDADDELEPGYIDAMASARDGWVRGSGGAHRVHPLLVPLLRRVHNCDLANAWASYPNKGRWPQLNECVIGTLVHRDLFEQVGGFRDFADDGTALTMYEDWDLWLRCWDAGAPLVYTDAIYRECVSTGRNTNAHEARPVYDAIWADHMKRTQP